jgi:hypothetical protein
MSIIAIFRRGLINDQTDFREKFFTLAIAIIVLALLGFGLNELRVYLNNSYIKSDLAMKSATRYIDRYRQEKAQYENLVRNAPQPVKRAEVDQTRKMILLKASNYNLDVRGMQALAAPAVQTKAKKDEPKPVNGVSYEMTVGGTWENTMRYLNDLQKEKALLNIRTVRMETIKDSNMVKATFNYKIYLSE